MNKYREYASVKKLPVIPPTIRPVQDDDEEKIKTLVIAGLNIIGERGLICPTVSIISCTRDTGQIFGWSLCLGNSDLPSDEGPYHFMTAGMESASTARGTELPNAMTYFTAVVDVELANAEADPRKLDEIFAYTLPYISDGGPPPAEGKSFDELVAEMPTSPSEHKAALLLKEQINSLLDSVKQELVEDLDYWKLFDELNKRFNMSGLNHAWKSNPHDPHYNPSFGTLQKLIAGKIVTVSFGLCKDRFASPCAVIQIVHNQSTDLH